MEKMGKGNVMLFEMDMGAEDYCFKLCQAMVVEKTFRKGRS